ncbi:MAG TPA: hypothetical protein VIM99_10630, partial [Blastocatellia bacterium]
MSSRKLRYAAWLIAAIIFGGILIFTAKTSGQKSSGAPDLKDIDSSASELRGLIERYVADRGSLSRSYPVEISPARRARFKQFYSDWLAMLDKLDFDALSQGGKVDYLLFKTHLNHELQQGALDSKAFAEIAPLAPFAQTIIDLAEARRRMEKIDPAKIAATLNDMNKQIEATRRSVESEFRGQQGKIKRTVANRAAVTVSGLRNTLRAWFGYYNGYDPLFTWWVGEPYKAVDQSLGVYAAFLSERGAGVRRAEAAPAVAEAQPPVQGAGGRGGGGFGRGRGNFSGVVVARPGDSSDIIGDPIGREGLMVELAAEMIPYTPEELIAIGWKELAWCENEMKKA